jgi:3-phosphoshikimate 1-carboxyvinyltransferase
VTPADARTFGGAAPLRGRLRVPGDKSISHRAYLFAALATGASRLGHVAPGDDVRATRLAIEHLGVRVRTAPGGVVTVRGTGAAGMSEADGVIDCGNSGTTMRVVAGLVAGRPFLTVLTGDASLRRRPMRRVVDPLRAMGAGVDGAGDAGRAPLVVRGGPLRGIEYDLPVPSAQVKAALALAGLQADGVTVVTTPSPTRDHTERMLAAAGAPVEGDGRTIRVRPGAPDPFELTVPGDASSAAFFAVAAAVTPGSDLVIEDVLLNPTRTGYVGVLARMGAAVDVEHKGERMGEPYGDLRVRHSALSGTVIAGDEIANVQDELPVLAVAAAFAEGVTEVRDAGELRVKETDRIGAIEQELAQLGVGVETWADGFAIRGGHPAPAAMKSHGDHRMAMAAAVAAHALDGSSTVRGWRCVATSYPGFEDDLRSVTGGG